VIHYGPMYGRPIGASLALCADPGVIPPAAPSATMSTHRPFINCPDCLKRLDTHGSDTHQLAAIVRR